MELTERQTINEWFFWLKKSTYRVFSALFRTVTAKQTRQVRLPSRSQPTVSYVVHIRNKTKTRRLMYSVGCRRRNASLDEELATRPAWTCRRCWQSDRFRLHSAIKLASLSVTDKTLVSKFNSNQEQRSVNQAIHFLGEDKLVSAFLWWQRR